MAEKNFPAMTSLKLLATRVAVKLFGSIEGVAERLRWVRGHLAVKKLFSNDLSKVFSHKGGSQAFWFSRRSSREVKMGPRSLGGQKAFQQ